MPIKYVCFLLRTTIIMRAQTPDPHLLANPPDVQVTSAAGLRLIGQGMDS